MSPTHIDVALALCEARAVTVLSPSLRLRLLSHTTREIDVAAHIEPALPCIQVAIDQGQAQCEAAGVPRAVLSLQAARPSCSHPGWGVVSAISSRSIERFEIASTSFAAHIAPTTTHCYPPTPMKAVPPCAAAAAVTADPQPGPLIPTRQVVLRLVGDGFTPISPRHLAMPRSSIYHVGCGYKGGGF